MPTASAPLRRQSKPGVPSLYWYVLGLMVDRAAAASLSLQPQLDGLLQQIWG